MTNQSLHIYTYTVPLPDDVNEAVLPGKDDSYTVYLSDKLNLEGRRCALIHAFHHIVHGDFEDISADTLERRAHEERRKL